MSNKNGLIGAQAFRNPSKPFYADSDAGAVLDQPTLVSTIALRSADASSTGYMTVGGAASGAYQGAVSIQAGDNSVSPGNQVCLTMRGSATGTIVEVGDNAQTNNLLYIAGAEGVAQVYDEKYNQPVALQTITIVASDPDCTPTGGAEVFRCGQAAVAQAGAGTIQFNRIQVPKTGAYVMQSQVTMGNNVGANTVVLPSTVVGGVPIWDSLILSMQEFSTVIGVPYSSFAVIGGDFQATATFASGSLTTKTYSTVVFLDSTKVYTVNLSANSALWNIGNAGQIKVELIAMC